MKKNITLAFRSLFKKGRHNAIKVLSLAVGLALGMVLIAKAYFEQTYDDFFPDGDRIYRIVSNYRMGGEAEKEYGQVSGAVAPGMKAEIPEVEAATRFTFFTEPGTTFYTEDKKKYAGDFIMADEHFFDVLPRPMVIGNAKEVLSKPKMVLVSEKIAQTMGMGADLIGKTIRLDNYPMNTLTIGGIFKDMPENSHLSFDIIISLESIGYFTGDGRENWLGNDRYRGYVKLFPGVSPESIAPAVKKMQERHQPSEELQKAGVGIRYSFAPLLKLHADDPGTKRMTIILSILAFALLFTAVMNYVLIVISSLVNRAKEIGVYKCYGAERKNIAAVMFSETTLHLLIALLGAVFVIILFRSTISELLKTSVMALLTPASGILLLIVCLLVYLIAGFIPAYLFSRIPIAAAFRTFNESRRNWKLGLLFVQFVAAAFLMTLLFIVGKQYQMMVNDNPGYRYDKLLYCKADGVSRDKRKQAVNELQRLSIVDKVSTTYTLPFEGASGNNILLEGSDRELFNYADLYDVDADYLPLMGIPIVEGRWFTRQSSVKGDVIVSRSFAKKLADLTGWKDGVVGKRVIFTEHGPGTIVGVYKEIRIGSLVELDSRGSAMFYSDSVSSTILVKLHEMTPENISKVTQVFEAAMPDKNINVIPYKSEMIDLYKDSKLFHDTVLIGGIVTLLISLIGLIGYTNDEISRRRKEIAIRRINGATMQNILRLFNINIIRISLPSIAFGCIASYFVAIHWQQQFAEKTPLSLWIFIVPGLLVFIIIQAVVNMDCYRTVNQNPVDSLKSE